MRRRDLFLLLLGCVLAPKVKDQTAYVVVWTNKGQTFVAPLFQEDRCLLRTIRTNG